MKGRMKIGTKEKKNGKGRKVERKEEYTHSLFTFPIPLSISRLGMEYRNERYNED